MERDWVEGTGSRLGGQESFGDISLRERRERRELRIARSNDGDCIVITRQNDSMFFSGEKVKGSAEN